jgi:hypothetical protein
VWCAYLGTPVDVYPSFPYTVTQSPFSYKEREFRSIDDVWDEIHKLCTQFKDRTVGQELYHLIPLFANPSVILEDWHFEMIQEYHYMTKFNIPLARSLDEAPASRLVYFDAIENEINAIMNFKAQKNG